MLSSSFDSLQAALQFALAKLFVMATGLGLSHLVAQPIALSGLAGADEKLRLEVSVKDAGLRAAQAQEECRQRSSRLSMPILIYNENDSY